jgi:hypothetical protein
MTQIDFDSYALGKINYKSKNKFENKYPKETEVIINLLKQTQIRKKETQLSVYSYKTIAEYCIEVLNYKMVHSESLRKIISRIAKENGCEL